MKLWSFVFLRASRPFWAFLGKAGIALFPVVWLVFVVWTSWLLVSFVHVSAGVSVPDRFVRALFRLFVHLFLGPARLLLALAPGWRSALDPPLPLTSRTVEFAYPFARFVYWQLPFTYYTFPY